MLPAYVGGTYDADHVVYETRHLALLILLTCAVSSAGA